MDILNGKIAVADSNGYNEWGQITSTRKLTTEFNLNPKPHYHHVLYNKTKKVMAKVFLYLIYLTVKIYSKAARNKLINMVANIPHKKTLVCAMFTLVIVPVLLYINNVRTDYFWKININVSDIVQIRVVSHSEWIPAQGNEDNGLWIYSAFFEDRDIETGVKIIAVAETRKMSFVYCEFYQRLTDSGLPVLVGKNRASFVPLKEYREKISRFELKLLHFKYRPYFLVCRAPDFSQNAPFYVAVGTSDEPDRTEPKHVLEVHHIRPDHRTNSTQIVMCMQPLHLNYGQVPRQALQFIEFIEIHSLLGVEKFIVYQESVTVEMKRILDYYVAKQEVVVFNWTLPFTSEPRTEIHSGAQVSALTDCYYRMMPTAKYIGHVDPDEILVPFQHKTLNELIKHVEQSSEAQDIASFSFLNVYFDMDQKHSEDYHLNESIAYPIYNLALTKRFNYPWSGLAKCIGRALWVDEPAIHNMKFIRRGTNVVLAEDLALLFHYRDILDSDRVGFQVQDLRIRSLAPQIKTQVMQVWRNLNLNL